MENRFLRRNKEYVWRDIGGEVVILNAEGTQVCLLNETAATIWTLCDGRRDVDAIARAIQGEYEVPHEEAMADVEAFAGQLVASGLAEWTDAD
jgi:pyrroloquinoline quinone biosynthesis protein D